MRIYLSEKKGKYNPGFYPEGRVPAVLVDAWIGDGVACPATSDNVAEWPAVPAPAGFDTKMVEDPDLGLDMVGTGDGDHTGLIENGEENDNG